MPSCCGGICEILCHIESKVKTKSFIHSRINILTSRNRKITIRSGGMRQQEHREMITKVLINNSCTQKTLTLDTLSDYDKLNWHKTLEYIRLRLLSFHSSFSTWVLVYTSLTKNKHTYCGVSESSE